MQVNSRFDDTLVAANNGPQLLPSHTPADLTKPACSAVYNQYVSDMKAVDAKYAAGWQEAAAAGPIVTAAPVLLPLWTSRRAARSLERRGTRQRGGDGDDHQ